MYLQNYNIYVKVRAYENMVGIVTVNYANHSGKSSAYSPIVRNIILKIVKERVNYELKLYYLLVKVI